MSILAATAGKFRLFGFFIDFTVRYGLFGIKFSRVHFDVDKLFSIFHWRNS